MSDRVDVDHAYSQIIAPLGSNVGPENSNPFLQFFGPVQHDVKVDPYEKMARTHDALPKYYWGRNEFLRSSVDHLVTAEQEIYTTLVLPIYHTTERNFKWTRMSFNVQVLGQLAHEGVSRLITQEELTRHAGIEYRGCAFILEHMFFRTEQGKRRYRQNLLHIRANVHETLAYLVVRAIDRCRTYDETFMKKFGQLKQTPKEIIQREVRDSFILHYGPKQFQVMLALINKRQQEFHHLIPDILMVPADWSIFYDVVPTTTEYRRYGGDGKIMTVPGPHANAFINKKYILETRLINVQQGRASHNPFSHRMQIGDHFYLLDPFYGDDHSNYTTRTMTIFVHRDDEDDTYVPIRMKEVAPYCMRWTDDGNLDTKVHYDSLKNVGILMDTGLWDKTSYDLMVFPLRGRTDLNNPDAWSVVSRLGHMICSNPRQENRFNLEAFTNMAVSAVGGMGQRNWSDGIDDLISLVKESNQMPFAGEYARQFITANETLLRAGKKNVYGGLNLPQDFTSTGKGPVVPPFINTWGMLRTLSVEASNVDGVYHTAGKRAKRAVQIILDLVRRVRKVASTSMFIDEMAMDSWLKYPGMDVEDRVATAIVYLLVGGNQPAKILIGTPGVGETGTDTTIAAWNTWSNSIIDLSEDGKGKLIVPVGTPPSEGIKAQEFVETVKTWPNLLQLQKTLYASAERYNRTHTTKIDPQSFTLYALATAGRSGNLGDGSSVSAAVREFRSHKDDPEGIPQPAWFATTSVPYPEATTTASNEPTAPMYAVAPFYATPGMMSVPGTPLLAAPSNVAVPSLTPGIPEPSPTSGMMQNARMRNSHSQIDDPMSVDATLYDAMDYALLGGRPREVAHEVGDLHSRHAISQTEQMELSSAIDGWEASLVEPRGAVRLFMQILIGCKVTRQQFFEWMDNDVMLPCEFLIQRPFITLMVHDAIAMKGGYETGVTIVGDSDFMLGDDAINKVHTGHYTFDCNAVVIDERQVFKMRAVACTDYIGGCNIRPFKSTNDIAKVTDAKRPPADIIIKMVTYGSLHCNVSTPNPLTVSGLPPHMKLHCADGRSDKWGVPEDGVYRNILNFSTLGGRAMWYEAGYSDTWMGKNVVTHRGEFHAYCPQTQRCDTSWANTGYFGDTGWTIGSGRVRAGGKQPYFPMEYKKPINLCI